MLNGCNNYKLLMEISPSYMFLKYLQYSFRAIYNQFYPVIRMAKIIELIQ